MQRTLFALMAIISCSLPAMELQEQHDGYEQLISEIVDVGRRCGFEGEICIVIDPELLEKEGTWGSATHLSPPILTFDSKISDKSQYAREWIIGHEYAHLLYQHASKRNSEYFSGAVAFYTSYVLCLVGFDSIIKRWPLLWPWLIDNHPRKTLLSVLALSAGVFVAGSLYKEVLKSSLRQRHELEADKFSAVKLNNFQGAIEEFSARIESKKRVTKLDSLCWFLRYDWQHKDFKRLFLRPILGRYVYSHPSNQDRLDNIVQLQKKLEKDKQNS
jgi:hypothetical protein